MLYCELDNAFNNKTYKTQKLDKNNTSSEYNIENIDTSYFSQGNGKSNSFSQKGQESDWATIDSDTELLPKKKPTVRTEKAENNSEKNKYSGTSLTKLIKNKKPTHRECLKLYYDPTCKSEYSFDTALKHVTKCSLCKKEISKKKSVKFESNSTKKYNLDDKVSDDNESNADSLNSWIDKIREQKTEKVKENFKNSDNKLKSIQTQIELQAPSPAPVPNPSPAPVSEESGKYQNILIQSTIQKYFEDMEERKALNEKLNKIYDILNLEVKKNEIIEKERSKYSSPDNNYVLIGISIVIVLLLVDIFIRIRF
jgi:hypothetical protein